MFVSTVEKYHGRDLLPAVGEGGEDELIRCSCKLHFWKTFKVNVGGCGQLQKAEICPWILAVLPKADPKRCHPMAKQSHSGRERLFEVIEDFCITTVTSVSPNQARGNGHYWALCSGLGCHKAFAKQTWILWFTSWGWGGLWKVRGHFSGREGGRDPCKASTCPLLHPPELLGLGLLANWSLHSHTTWCYCS